jgi:hypothetical protein
MNELIITPKTKILQLIEAYPQLEDILVQYTPAFKKLKNPALRKTVAKIATLQQAAAIGNVKVEDLINHLRKEVGQNLFAGDSSNIYITQKPNWFAEKLIEKEIDIKEMLEGGEQPVNQVIADLNKMSRGKIYKLVAPFLPAPLIDKASSLKLKHWIHKIDDEIFYIYFYNEP